MNPFRTFFSRKTWGMRLLAAGLILWGASVLVPALRFEGRDHLFAILAIAAGVLIFLDW
jgi:hypothetical protein